MAAPRDVSRAQALFDNYYAAQEEEKDKVPMGASNLEGVPESVRAEETDQLYKYTPDVDPRQKALFNEYYSREQQPALAPVEDDTGDFMGGLKQYVDQSQATLYGLGGLAADLVGADETRDKMFEGYQRNIEEGAQYDRQQYQYDYLTSDQAGLGDWVDAGQYFAGKALGNVAEFAVGMGIGSAVAKSVAKQAVKSSVKKQVKEGVRKQPSKEAIERVAADKAAGAAKIGGRVALGGLALKEGLGSTYGGAAQEQLDRGNTLDDVNLTKVVGYGTAAAGAELAGDLLLLGATKFAPIDALKDAVDGGNVVSRFAKGAVGSAVTEAPTEVLQTTFETLGADQDITTDEFKANLRQSAFAGAFQGGITGGTMNAVFGSKNKAEAPPTQEEVRQRWRALAESNQRAQTRAFMNSAEVMSEAAGAENIQAAIDAQFGIGSEAVKADAELAAESKKAAAAAKKEHARIQAEYDAMFSEPSGTIVSGEGGAERELTLGELINLGESEIDGETDATSSTDAIDYQEAINRIVGVTREASPTTKKGILEAYNEPSGEFGIDPETQVEYELTVGEALERSAGFPQSRSSTESATSRANDTDYVKIVNSLTGVGTSGVQSNPEAVNAAFNQPSGVFTVDPESQQERELSVGELLRRNAAYQMGTRTGEDVSGLAPTFLPRTDAAGNVTYDPVAYNSGAMGAITTELVAQVKDTAQYDALFATELKGKLRDSDINKKTGQPNAASQRRLANMRLMTTDRLRNYAKRHEGKWYGDAASIILTERLQAMQNLVYGDAEVEVTAPEIETTSEGTNLAPNPEQVDPDAELALEANADAKADSNLARAAQQQRNKEETEAAISQAEATLAEVAVKPNVDALVNLLRPVLDGLKGNQRKVADFILAREADGTLNEFYDLRTTEGRQSALSTRLIAREMGIKASSVDSALKGMRTKFEQTGLDPKAALAATKRTGAAPAATDVEVDQTADIEQEPMSATIDADESAEGLDIGDVASGQLRVGSSTNPQIDVAPVEEDAPTRKKTVATTINDDAEQQAVNEINAARNAELNELFNTTGGRILITAYNKAAQTQGLPQYADLPMGLKLELVSALGNATLFKQDDSFTPLGRAVKALPGHLKKTVNLVKQEMAEETKDASQTQGATQAVAARDDGQQGSVPEARPVEPEMGGAPEQGQQTQGRRQKISLKRTRNVDTMATLDGADISVEESRAAFNPEELYAYDTLNGGDFNAALNYLEFAKLNAESLGLDVDLIDSLAKRFKELQDAGVSLEIQMLTDAASMIESAGNKGEPLGWAAVDGDIGSGGSVNPVLRIGLAAYQRSSNIGKMLNGLNPETVLHEMHHTATVASMSAARSGLLPKNVLDAVVSLRRSRETVNNLIKNANLKTLVKLAAKTDVLGYGSAEAYQDVDPETLRTFIAESFFANERELVTQVMTSPKAILFLNELDKTTAAGKGRALLRGILNAVAKVLGRTASVKANTALVQSVMHSNKILLGVDATDVAKAAQEFNQIQTLLKLDDGFRGTVEERLNSPAYSQLLESKGLKPDDLIGDSAVANIILQDADLAATLKSVLESLGAKSTGGDVDMQRRPPARAARKVINQTGNVAKAISAAADALPSADELVSTSKLAAMTLRQIAERSKSAAVKGYVTVTQAITRTSKERIAAAHTMNMKWAKLQNKYPEAERTMSRLMIDTTLAGFDPTVDTPQTELQRQLADQFAKLPKDVQDLYAEVRDYYEADFRTKVDLFNRAMLEAEAAGQNVNTLKNDLKRMNSVKGPYFPLKRLDKYFAVGRSPELDALIQRHEETPLVGDELAMMKKMRLDPKHYVVESFPSLRQAKARSRQFESEMGVGYQSVGREMFQAEAKSLPDLDRMLEYFNTDNSYDKKAVDAIRGTLAYMYADLLPENSGIKSQMKREGVSGASVDMRRVFANVAVGNAHRIATLEHSRDLSGAVKELRTLQRSRKLEDQYVANEIIKRSNTALQFEQSPVADTLLSLSYFANLGVSPAYIFTNMTQVPMITAPWLAARFGVDNSAKALFAAYAESAKMLKSNFDAEGWRAEVDWSGTYAEDSGEARMLEELLNSNLLDITIEQDLSAVAKGSDAGFGRGGDFMQLLNTPVRFTEVANRLVTGLATYRLAVESPDLKDLPAEERHRFATEMASQAVANTQLDYSGLNAPRMMNSILGSRTLGKLAFQFRKYQQGMLYLLLSSAKDSLKGADAKTRSEARKTLTGLFVTTSLMAGAAGVPFIGSVAFIVNAIGSALGDDDDPLDVELEMRNYIYDMTGDAAITAAVMDGLPTLVGADLSKRVGMGDIASPLPFMRQQDAPRAQLGEALVNVGGAGVSYGLNAYDGLLALMDGDIVKGLEKMIPAKGVQNVLKAYRYSQEGMTDSKGNTIKDDEAFNGYEILVRGLGFSTTQESNYYKANRAVMNKKSAVEDAKADLTQRYMLARESGDKDELAKVRKDITGFNERNPKSRIKQRGLNTSYRNRRKSQRRNETGIKTGRAYRPYLDEARFTGEN